MKYRFSNIYFDLRYIIYSIEVIISTRFSTSFQNSKFVIIISLKIKKFLELRSCCGVVAIFN